MPELHWLHFQLPNFHLHIETNCVRHLYEKIQGDRNFPPHRIVYIGPLCSQSPSKLALTDALCLHRLLDYGEEFFFQMPYFLGFLLRLHLFHL